MDQQKTPPLRYLWTPLPEGGARLLRVYGMQPELELPEKIEDHLLTEIGAYCFAAAEHLPEDGVRVTVVGDIEGSEKYLYSLSGDKPEKIILPDTVKVIRDLAFYNCRKLRCIQTGAGISEIGSDVFMNCGSLTVLELRCGIGEPSGAGVILSRIASELEVRFLEQQDNRRKMEPEAVLLYPEYQETYDEIAPAHIFGRNITGEGFRARQLFRQGRVQLEQYDEIFAKVSVEEPVITSGRMALYRLQYPVGLADRHREKYEDYLRQNAWELGKFFVKRREREVIFFLCSRQYLSGMDLEQVIVYCTTENWGEGSASLLEWKHQFGKGDRRNRYSFDFDEF